MSVKGSIDRKQLVGYVTYRGVIRMVSIEEIALFFAHGLFLLGLAILSFGLGMPCLRSLRLRFTDNLSLVSLACGLGAWILSQVVMVLGIFGGLSKPSLLCVLAALFALSLASIGQFRRSLKGILETALRSLRSKPSSFLKTGLLLFCVFYLGTCLLGLSLPDWTYDGLAYHLYLPRLYLESGRIQFFPYYIMSAFPQNMEMLHLIGLAVGGEGFARVFNLMITCLCALLLASFAKEVSGAKQAGFLTAILFLMAPGVFEETSWALVDLSYAFYALAALFCLKRGYEEGDKRWLFLAGLFSAGALGIKYLYFIQLASLNLLLVFLWFWRPTYRRYPLGKSLLIFSGTTLLFGFPWYLRSTLATHNPTYPFFYSLFDGAYWTQELEKGLLAVRYQFGPEKTVLNFIFLPFFLLKEGYLSFAFIPVLVFLKHKNRTWLQVIGGLCLFEASVWFFLFTFLMRYGMFWFLLWCLLLGSALGFALEEKRVSNGFRRTVAFLLVCTAFLSLRPVVTVAHHGASLLLGFKTRETLRRNFMESYPIFSYINASLPEEARVASFGDPRGYYCRRPFFPIHPDVSGYVDLNQMPGAAAYYRRLKEIGVTHLIYNPRRAEIFRKRYPHWIELQKELEKGYLEKIRQENWVSLYRLR